MWAWTPAGRLALMINPWPERQYRSIRARWRGAAFGCDWAVDCEDRRSPACPSTCIRLAATTIRVPACGSHPDIASRKFPILRTSGYRPCVIGRVDEPPRAVTKEAPIVYAIGHFRHAICRLFKEFRALACAFHVARCGFRLEMGCFRGYDHRRVAGGGASFSRRMHTRNAYAKLFKRSFPLANRVAPTVLRPRL